jgi:YD repeat-containing protein
VDAISVHRDHVHASVAGPGGGCADGVWVVPIAGEYTITARFGQIGAHWTTTHTGVDLAAPVGRSVLAAAGGQVTYVGWDGPYGQRVEITHPDGTRTWYAHLSATTVLESAAVVAGDVIGRVGMTGNTTGPHLHFEVRSAPHGQPVDAVPWMASRGVQL